MPLSYLPPILPAPRPVREQFDVLVVDSGFAVRSFAGVPWTVYRGDHHWTPPLLADRRRAVDPRRDSERGLFFAQSRSVTAMDTATGSIAAWADSKEPGAGRFGMFEMVNNALVGDALLTAAETWLFEHVPRLTGITGPHNLQPLRFSGLLIDGFDQASGGLLPYNPPYYPELFELAGYEPVDEWHAYVLPLQQVGGGAAMRPHGRLDYYTGKAIAEVQPVLSDLYWRLEHDFVSGLMSALAAPHGRATREVFSVQGRWGWKRVFDRAVAVVCGEAGASGAILAIPDPARALRWSGGSMFPAGWLSFLLGLKRANSVHVIPPALTRGVQLLSTAEVLYRATLAAAAAQGYHLALIAPVSATDKESADVLEGLGARISQRYCLYGKSV